MAVRLGVDVGGTFTKAAAVDAASGEVVARAVVPTSHAAPDGIADGVVESIRAASEAIRLAGRGPILMVGHSTTLAVNALLEGDLPSGWVDRHRPRTGSRGGPQADEHRPPDPCARTTAGTAVPVRGRDPWTEPVTCRRHRRRAHLARRQIDRGQRGLLGGRPSRRARGAPGCCRSKPAGVCRSPAHRGPGPGASDRVRARQRGDPSACPGDSPGRGRGPRRSGDRCAAGRAARRRRRDGPRRVCRAAAPFAVLGAGGVGCGHAPLPQRGRRRDARGRRDVHEHRRDSRPAAPALVRSRRRLRDVPAGPRRMGRRRRGRQSHPDQGSIGCGRRAAQRAHCRPAATPRSRMPAALAGARAVLAAPRPGDSRGSSRPRCRRRPIRTDRHVRRQCPRPRGGRRLRRGARRWSVRAAGIRCGRRAARPGSAPARRGGPARSRGGAGPTAPRRDGRGRGRASPDVTRRGRRRVRRACRLARGVAEGPAHPGPARGDPQLDRCRDEPHPGCRGAERRGSGHEHGLPGHRGRRAGRDRRRRGSFEHRDDHGIRFGPRDASGGGDRLPATRSRPRAPRHAARRGNAPGPCRGNPGTGGGLARRDRAVGLLRRVRGTRDPQRASLGARRPAWRDRPFRRRRASPLWERRCVPHRRIGPGPTVGAARRTGQRRPAGRRRGRPARDRPVGGDRVARGPGCCRGADRPAAETTRRATAAGDVATAGAGPTIVAIEREGGR